MTVEAKIRQLMERAVPNPPMQEPRIPQGSSIIDQEGQDDVEDLGSAKAGAAASAEASTTGLPTGQKPGSGEPITMQGSSETKDPDEEDLSDEGDLKLGVVASAKAGAAIPYPTSNPGGEKTIQKQGSSDTPTPGQAIEEPEFMKAMEDAQIPESARAALQEAFEKAVVSRVEKELEDASTTLAETVHELAEVKSQELYESVNEYLNYAVETWMEKNTLAIEQGLRSEIVESFISGLKDLFESHAIEVPEEKYDALKESNAKVEELTTKLNESIESVVRLTEANRTLERRQIVERVTKEMVATDAEKFTKLVEDVEFDSPESFEEKLGTMKSRYFAKNSESKSNLSESVSKTAPEADEVISTYTKALSKTAKR